jgi:uncharacterized protein YkwD
VLIYHQSSNKKEVMMSFVSNIMNGPAAMMGPTSTTTAETATHSNNRRRPGENNSFVRREARSSRVPLKTNKKQKQLSFNDDAPHNGNLGNPMISILSSNHVQVNRLRTVCNLPPFIRSNTLDQIASNFAIRMANRNKILPKSFLTIDDDDDDSSDAGDATNDPSLISSSSSSSIQINCHCGESVLDIHRSIIEKKIGFENSLESILSSAYSQMGVGTAVGSNGILYMCQIIR